ncbi:uncharacterized protein JCM15063_002339 [Sporobolomyces koalae]|uniref:uncharacterized protein n=1 Tax=Sporobolomyces koalae TaxID=500713 RepID=UPI003171D0E4
MPVFDFAHARKDQDRRAQLSAAQISPTNESQTMLGPWDTGFDSPVSAESGSQFDMLSFSPPKSHVQRSHRYLSDTAARLSQSPTLPRQSAEPRQPLWEPSSTNSLETSLVTSPDSVLPLPSGTEYVQHTFRPRSEPTARGLREKLTFCRETSTSGSSHPLTELASLSIIPSPPSVAPETSVIEPASSVPAYGSNGSGINLLIAPSSSTVSPDPYPDLYPAFEQLVTSRRPPLAILPKNANWCGPCCGTVSQRDDLSSSFVFENMSHVDDKSCDDGTWFVSETMGLGCTGFDRTVAIDLLQRELALRKCSLDPDPAKEEAFEEQEAVEWIGWGESDFLEEDDSAFMRSFSSDSRFSAKPTILSKTSQATPNWRPGPPLDGLWNFDAAPMPVDEPQVPRTQLVALTVPELEVQPEYSPKTKRLLDALGDSEDVSTRFVLPRCPSAYEP